MSQEKTFVIILGYNNLESLIETIYSFKKQDYSNLKIILSDNNSTDDSVQYVKKNFPEVHVIENNTNLGWSGGNNIGIDFALSKKADYILLSNNDIEIDDPGLISQLVNNMQSFSNDKVKIMGTKVNYLCDKSKTHNDGWMMFPKEEKKGFIYNVFRQQCQLVVPPKFRIVDSVDGSFIFIKADLFAEISKLDDNLFMYADEIEFSYRAWQKGYISLVDTTLKIFHKVDNTGKINSPFSMYYRTRNLFYIQKKHKDSINSYFLKTIIKGVFKNLFKVIVQSNEFNGKRTNVFFAILKGFFDGYFFNRMGKRF